jgi:hypothetical protein
MEKEQQKKLLTEITAVQWLVNELMSYAFHERIDMAEWEELKKLSRKAKQMQKEQHEQTWNAAHQAGRFEGKAIAEENWQTFRQYYNEKYKP